MMRTWLLNLHTLSSNSLFEMIAKRLTRFLILDKSVLRYLWLDLTFHNSAWGFWLRPKTNKTLSWKSEMEQVVQGLLRQNRRQTWAFDQCLVEQNIAVLDGPFCQIDNFERLACQAFWFSFSLSTMSTWTWNWDRQLRLLWLNEKGIYCIVVRIVQSGLLWYGW